jgi:RHS repeat-associated protein
MRHRRRCVAGAQFAPPTFVIFGHRFGTRYLRSRKLRCMVTSVTPVLEQHMPSAQAHAGGQDAYMRFDFGACLDSSTSTISFARQTPDQSHVKDRNRAGEYCCNQQYSVTAITTSTGTIAERYAYSAYGQPTILDASGSILNASAISNRYTYTGREWDATLGLYHFRARWMSPSAGRFLARDPIGYRGGRHLYVNGVDLRWNDPRGTTAIPPAVMMIAASLVLCETPFFVAGLRNYPDDENMRHCWTACQASAGCGALVTQLLGFGFEVFSGALEQVIDGNTDLLNHFLDLANNAKGSYCAGMENAFIPSPIAGWARWCAGMGCAACCAR